MVASTDGCKTQDFILTLPVSICSTALTLTQPKILNFKNYGRMSCGPVTLMIGEWEEYDNISKKSWGITNDYGGLFTEQYAYIEGDSLCGMFLIS